MKKLSELINLLTVVEENVLEEAAAQPALFYEVARYRVARMRKRSQAVAEYDSRRAQLSLSLRAKSATAGEKFTEGTIKDRVDSKIINGPLRKAMEDAYASEELSKLLVEAYRMRRDGIRILAEARQATDFKDTHEVDRIQRKLSQKARELTDRKAQLEEEEDDE